MTATVPRPAPAVPMPRPAFVPADPPQDETFPPAPELAAAIAKATRQVELDRRKADELARLRAIQDRD